MGDFWDYTQPKGAVLLAGTVLEDSASGAAVPGFGGHTLVQLVLDVTACDGGAVDDKLDVLVDRRTSGGGWVNVAQFPQVAGNAANKTYVAVLDHRLVTAVPAVVTGDLSADAGADTVRPLIQGDELRARVVTTKVSDPVAKWAFTVTAHGERL